MQEMLRARKVRQEKALYNHQLNEVMEDIEADQQDKHDMIHYC